MTRGRKPQQQIPTYRQDEPVKFLYKRGGQAIEIDAVVTALDPFTIVYLSLGTKECPRGRGIRCFRVLRTADERARIRPLQPDEPPTELPDPEQALLDAAWQGEIDGLTTSKIAQRYDLARSRAIHVLARIVEGKSPDPRFGKPDGSTFHDKRARISGDRILSREPLAGPSSEYRWFVQSDGER